MSGAFQGIDEAVGRSRRELERVLREPACAARALRIAELYATEADAWSQLFELTTVRPVWRAALVAEVVARQQARRWSARAAGLTDLTCGDPLSELVLFVSTPAGDELPRGLAEFVATLNDATTPALTRDESGGGVG